MTTTEGEAPLIVLVHGGVAGSLGLGGWSSTSWPAGGASPSRSTSSPTGLSARARPRPSTGAPSRSKRVLARAGAGSRNDPGRRGPPPLTEQLRKAPPRLWAARVAVVAHSLGGAVATAAAELAPEVHSTASSTSARSSRPQAAPPGRHPSAAVNADQGSGSTPLQVGRSPRDRRGALRPLRGDLPPAPRDLLRRRGRRPRTRRLAYDVAGPADPFWSPIRCRRRRPGRGIRRSYIICSDDKVLPTEVQKLIIDGMDRARRNVQDERPLPGHLAFAIPVPSRKAGGPDRRRDKTKGRRQDRAT